MWYYAGASSNEMRNIGANYLLQFEMIKYAKQKGLKYYDMGGLYALTEKGDSLYRFKNGFCKKYGITEYVGEIDVSFNNFKYFIYLLLEEANKIKKKIYKWVSKFNVKNSVINEEIKI